MLASFLSLRAVESQLMSTSRPIGFRALGSVGCGMLTGNGFSLEALREFRAAVADR
jgi:hypothetical protein